MAKWQCNSCAAVIDSGPFSGRPEDAVKEIDAADSSACPVCDQREGYRNLDYRGIILPFEAGRNGNPRID